MGFPARHNIVLQSPALATKSLSLTTRATTAVQPGCQSFCLTFLDLRKNSSSFLNSMSVFTNASVNASAGLHTQISFENIKIKISKGDKWKTIKERMKTFLWKMMFARIQELLELKTQQLLHLHAL